MPNLRIVYDNATARASSLTASTTAGTGSFAVTNLQTDVKSMVHRATTTSVTYITTWTVTELLSCVAYPFCNLSPTATMRVRIYSDTAGTVLVYDGTALPACPAAAVALRGFTALAASMAYGYGGGACARAWFTTIGAKRLVVDIVDTSNLSGSVEASIQVAGNYWSPVYNAEFGANLLPMDMSKHSRSDAGDLLTEIGPRSRKISMNLSFMPPADRTAMMNILRGNGMANPVFLSLFPGSSDYELERDHTIYGKLSAISAITLPFFNAYSTPIEFEEV